MAAPPGLEVRDALTPCVIFARLLACLEVREFSRRSLAVYLTGARVTYGINTDLMPNTVCRGDTTPYELSPNADTTTCHHGTKTISLEKW